jgi:oligoendopeptidase F
MLHLTPNPSPKGEGNSGNPPSLKEKEQGDEVFSVWDVGAPLGHSDKDFTFEEAYDLHLSVMQDFDSDFYEYSKRMIEEERIDVFPRAGKRGGAYASYRK